MDWIRIGIDIKHAREKKGMLQIDLAKELGVSNVFISQIEASKKKPSAENLIKISKILDINFFEH